MKSMPKEITLDVTQNVINVSNKLRDKFALTQICPFATAAKNVFKKKQFSLYVNGDAELFVKKLETGQYFTYKPRAVKTAAKLANSFDNKKTVKPAKFVYKLVEENI